MVCNHVACAPPQSLCGSVFFVGSEVQSSLFFRGSCTHRYFDPSIRISLQALRLVLSALNLLGLNTVSPMFIYAINYLSFQTVWQSPWCWSDQSSLDNTHSHLQKSWLKGHEHFQSLEDVRWGGCADFLLQWRHSLELKSWVGWKSGRRTQCPQVGGGRESSGIAQLGDSGRILCSPVSTDGRTLHSSCCKCMYSRASH